LLDRPDRVTAFTKKKPARELRQGGSYYRCCIPALAGFVSPQSIAPDGGEISSHQRDAQLENATQGRCDGVLVSVKNQRIDSALRFCLHRAREMARVSLAWFCFCCGDILHNACQSAWSLQPRACAWFVRSGPAVVRRHEHDHDDNPNTKSSGRDRGAGLSLL